MAIELAYVLINPHTIRKSRTGGVIARYIGRTDLRLVGARMMAPSLELAERYAEMVRHADPEHCDTCQLIADYIRSQYAPNATTGLPRRVMMLLFEGEDAVQKIWQVTGSATSRSLSGETIRDTYGDYVLDEKGNVVYFEPAVLVAPNRERARATLRLWAEYTGKCGGVAGSAFDVPKGESVQKTLVMLKPDNFKVQSLRPGNIIDILSVSGLRIVGVKKFSMTIAQAEAFYWPVLASLDSKFQGFGPPQVADALSRELRFPVPVDMVRDLCLQLGPLFAKAQFENIVEFMTGYKPSQCSESDKQSLGREDCLGLLYEGVDAVCKIRDILGTTDPSKARPGSVRREFGSNIMVNAAHASDSPENALREMRIIRFEDDNVRPLVDKYYGPLPSLEAGEAVREGAGG
jgi:nucleoside diphosphate kinase